MNHALSTSSIAAYLKSNAVDSGPAQHVVRQDLPAVTISRQPGARGTTTGKLLCKRLQEDSDPQAAPWTLFDRNLMTEVLKENQLPEALAKYLPEDKVSVIDTTIGEIVGLHPSLWKIQQQCAQTILRLCHVGNVIIVGRGGNIIALGMHNVLNVRLVGSLERRVEHLTTNWGMTKDEAHAYIKTEDTARRKYIKTTYSQDIDDATLYDIVINSDHFSDEALVETLIQALRAKQTVQ